MERKKQSFEINYIVILKTFLLGFLSAEVFILSRTIGDVVVEESIVSHKENWLWIIGISYFLMMLVYLFSKSFFEKTKVLLKSRRFDLMIMLLSGFIFVFAFGGLGANYVKGWAKSISWLQLTLLVLLPVIVFISLIIRKIQLGISKERIYESFFMSDKEGKEKSDDKFGFIDQAERFAERVFNQGSSESLVFGIDAPWGTGKSTFVNLCKEHWKENYQDQMIVYSFDPLRYENKENLLRKFIDGLINAIRGQVFAPEIESLVSKYARHLKDSKASVSFLGLSLSLPLVSESMDEVFEKLETALLYIDKKIIIIVDDLDRLDFSAISEVLFVVKKSFTLPNISYVICYDTENIATFDQKNIDKEKISEFLEKFINVKTSLYLDNKLLLEYFTANKDDSLSKNLLANPELISKAVEGLKDIFNSNDFHYYLPFIGDARKLKRLINTILLLEVEKTDLDNYDFDKQDLIHLLLIYINYPNVFRKIYNAETQEKRGFFSVVSKFDDGYPKCSTPQNRNDDTYKNSTYYTNYLEKLTDNQKFILNKVFQRLNDSKPTEEMITSYACFNGSMWGGGNRNLEAYLNLITKMSRSPKTDQYRFYINSKDEILREKSIKEVLSKEEFSEGETNQKQLWRVLVNSSGTEFTPAKAKEVIDYAVSSLPQYSTIKIDDIAVGLRDDLSFYIAKFLDKVGWLDERGGYGNNTDENVIQIAQWIFGEDKYEGEGILDVLGNEDRGIMGLHDLIVFRLTCCADRGGDIFNLSRALSKYESPKAPTDGDTRVIVVEEMRNISQKVFQIFRSQYIDKKKNIFDEIDDLTIETVSGNYLELIKSKVDSIILEEILLQTKSRIKSFIIYQLGNTIISHGIGCGYYDTNGNKDQKEINYLVNNYLFDYCFNPQDNEKNYNHFLDYLLINLSNTFDEPKPHISEFTKVLEKDRLTTYWREHSNTIKSKDFEKENRKVYTNNFTVSYSEHLIGVYKVLDELLEIN